jgi:RNA polymerase sigma factor for flagellar operon FliA
MLDVALNSEAGPVPLADISERQGISLSYLEQENPLHHLLEGNLRQRVMEAIEALPEREQLVLTLYYQEELNLKEIGAVLEVGESRVSQLHSQAIKRLRTKLGKL